MLYQFLIDDFGFVKVSDNYDSEIFGNFVVELRSGELTLIYINDRSFLTIDIANEQEPNQKLPLIFLKNFIENNRIINTEDELPNSSRIEELNSFIRKELVKIRQFFTGKKFYSTKEEIDRMLKDEFKKNHPKMFD